MEHKKSLYIIITILLIIVAFETTYVIVDKNNNKENKEQNNQEVQENNKNNESENKKENDTYGYAVIGNSKDDNTSSKLVELHKSGENKIVAEYSDRIYGLTKKHDKIYYSISESSTKDRKAFYIDLNDPKLQPVELSSGVNVSFDFDFNEEYIFYHNEHNKLKRYNRNTKKEETIFTKKEGFIFEIFMANSKLYMYTEKQDKKEYYTIDFNGENLKSITEEEYKKAAESIGYLECAAGYNDQYLMYNNKKVSLSEDEKKVMYNGKEVYSAKDNRKIILYYSSNQNEIAFQEYEGELEILNPKYYTYNLETNSLTEISKDNIYNISPLYLNN